jgi:hypothetical protein
VGERDGASFSELLVDVQRRLETLYALDPEAPVTDFLIAYDEAAHLPGGGSRTLVSQEGDSLSLAVVFEKAVGDDMARADPRVLLDASNLGAFSTLTEEVSHFLYLLYRARLDRPVTQLELELQAEVDKYLTCTLTSGVDLRERLFERFTLDPAMDAAERERYLVANENARAYADALHERYVARGAVPEMLGEVRAFYRLGMAGKLERIRRG